MNEFMRTYQPKPESRSGDRDPNTLTLDQIVKAQIQQESSGRVGQIGDPTKYGRAYGLMQVQPATGKAMARKLGIEWRPDLMTGTTPEAADYQIRIGRAYLEESLDAYDGDVRMGLRRYQGGPDTRIWGKENAAYPDLVLKYVDWDAKPAPPPAPKPIPSSKAGPPPKTSPRATPQPLRPEPAPRAASGWHPKLLEDLLPHLKRVGEVMRERAEDFANNGPWSQQRQPKAPPKR